MELWPQFKGKVQNFGMDVKSLAGLESLKKKSIFGKAKLINLSVMQVFESKYQKIVLIDTKNCHKNYKICYLH